MKYRKKPVVIEAVQWTGENTEELHNFLGYFILDGLGFLVIQSLEGDHLASPNDWIIKGVKGEFYACKPDIFELTYEKVETTK